MPGGSAHAFPVRTDDFALFAELVIAGINDGRFPAVPNPPILTHAGESAYASFNAALMKEVAVREFRGGTSANYLTRDTSSVSIPLGSGVRYRVGGFRGQSVEVGIQMVTDDTGLLVITSDRTVFTGQKKTLEFLKDRLVGLQQYKDGLRLNVSNRQAASLFKLPSGQSPSIACALISATVARP